MVSKKRTCTDESAKRRERRLRETSEETKIRLTKQNERQKIARNNQDYIQTHNRLKNSNKKKHGNTKINENNDENCLNTPKEINYDSNILKIT